MPSPYKLPSRLKTNSENAFDFEGSDDLIVIGIDFGTTYSGVAWATVADFQAEQINFITNWPGTGREEGKAPTELFYEHGQIMWGYEIPADADPVRWFKLLILKEEDLAPDLRSSEFLLRGRRMLRENNKSAIDLIADYLRALWKHTLDTIIKARGASVVDALRLHVVITIPAIWRGYARQSMEKAAKKSGILDLRPAGTTTMSLAPEPEAAALSTLCEPGRSTKKGDVYIICDAGGGTVDLISYEIGQVKPIALHEAVEGTGGLCGGIFIDEEFERVCKTRLGRQWDRLSKAGIKDIMKGEWEYAIKPQFKPGNYGKEYIVGIPAEAFINTSLDDSSRQPVIKNGRIHFKEAHIKEAFIRVFSDIEELTNTQIKTARGKGLSVTGIILVGGLGGSPYLYDHLKGKYEDAKISILQSSGIKPRTAICRGAVFKGFLDQSSQASRSQPNLYLEAPISVISTVSRASFGTNYDTNFDKMKHRHEDKYWDVDESKWKVENQMHWYIKKGDNISKKNPVRKSYYRIIKNPKGKFLSLNLYQCDDLVPSDRKTSSVKFMCEIICTLDVKYSDLKDFTTASGEKCKRLEYELEMTPSGATSEFVVYIDGRRQGGQNVDINFQ